MDLSNRDLMTVNQIANELDKLIASLKTGDATDDKDVRDLEDARDLVQKYADENPSEAKPSLGTPDMPSTDVVKPVDTGVLTGPMSGLKNFLVQRQRDNESQ